MKTLKRDSSVLHCCACGTDKPARAFYVSNLSICMDCKREKVNEYKRRTGYNVAYKQRKAVAA